MQLLFIFVICLNIWHNALATFDTATWGDMCKALADKENGGTAAIAMVIPMPPMNCVVMRTSGDAATYDYETVCLMSLVFPEHILSENEKLLILSYLLTLGTGLWLF